MAIEERLGPSCEKIHARYQKMHGEWTSERWRHTGKQKQDEGKEHDRKHDFKVPDGSSQEEAKAEDGE
eukprot:6076489-Pyramimonas_sp.AAC.1